MCARAAPAHAGFTFYFVKSGFIYVQREEIRRRSRKEYQCRVHELDCDIDVHALTAYVEEHGEGKAVRPGTGSEANVCASSSRSHEAGKEGI